MSIKPSNIVIAASIISCPSLSTNAALGATLA